MTDKGSTPLPTTVPAEISSPAPPNPKRAKLSSPDRPAQKLELEMTSNQPQAADGLTVDGSSKESAVVPDDQPLAADDDELEADDRNTDSAFESDHSDTTSISSSIYQGHFEHGRRYQTKREGGNFFPSDQKQFESMQAAHLVYMILDSCEKNTLFRSPIGDNPQNILDVGTGNGIWAMEVSDLYPSAVVRGFDLYPPPEGWVPPNCKLEVDDALKPWMFDTKFEFIHMRDLASSFTDKQWTGVYKQAYDNLVPGGWFEEAEPSIDFLSDDGSVKPGSLLAGWGTLLKRAIAAGGRNLHTLDENKAMIEAAGFINVHTKLYKVPYGDWTKNPVLKEAGQFHKQQIMEGLEGYLMYLMTKFGEPEPWTAAEVQVHLARVRKEFAEPGLHAYTLKRRIWAQKPYDA